MKLFLFGICVTALLGLTACGDDPVTGPKDYKSVLNDVGTDVILTTYALLASESQLLANALNELKNNQTSLNLEGARAAWRFTRTPWERSEGFLFGPVDQQGIDPSIDSWPVNETDLNAVLNSSEVLTKTYIDGLDGTLKGFHTIEYLLFGINGQKTVGDFTARQYEYLVATGLSLLGATQQLHNSWSPLGENYITHILRAGEAGEAVYPSQKSALQEIVTGLITIADEVANGKINDPFSQQNLTLEESRFSANSKADFADNIRSIRNIYLGSTDGTEGEGISVVIKAKDTALDEQVRDQIEDAIQKIEAMEGTFSSAIFNAPQSVTAAKNSVRDLQQVLESEVLPIITNL